MALRGRGARKRLNSNDRLSEVWRWLRDEDEQTAVEDEFGGGEERIGIVK